MKIALCFVLLLSALVAVQGACSLNDIEGLIAEATNRATAIGTECAAAGVVCGEGSCWDAIESYYAWFEDCYSEFEEFGILNLREAVDAIEETLCGDGDGTGGLIDLIGNTFTCLQDGTLTSDLQDAALEVADVCAAEARDSICSKKCADAIVKYQGLLYECYSFDDATADQSLAGLRGQLETYCELVEPAAACQQVGARHILDVQDTCALQSGADGLQCSSDCRAAIAAVESTTNERCFNFGSELIASWQDLCDPECGPKAFEAYLDAMSACEEVNWSAIDGCPADCSEKIDIAADLVGCFPNTNMMRRTIESMKVLKDDVCSANPSSSPGSACVLNQMSDVRDDHSNDWAYLLRYCRQDGHCSTECRKEVNNYMATAKNCYDDDLGVLSQPGDVKDALKNVRGACNGQSMMNLQLTGISRDEILENVNDFLRRVSLATNTVLEDLILIAVEYIERVTSRDQVTSVSIEHSGKIDEDSQNNLSKYGLEGEVEESEPVDGNSNSNNSPASALVASVFTIAAVAVVALLQ